MYHMNIAMSPISLKGVFSLGTAHFPRGSHQIAAAAPAPSSPQANRANPTVFFVSHPSLLLGDIQYFLTTWPQSSRDALICIEPDFSPAAVREQYPGLRMQVPAPPVAHTCQKVCSQLPTPARASCDTRQHLPQIFMTLAGTCWDLC